jgi:transcriptional regulator GlxA family with amidase domain
MPFTVGIFVFENVEVLDFAGPYEVFTTATRVHSRIHPSDSTPFDVFTVARTNNPVRARAGLKVYPDHNFESHPLLDVLVVPGGVVTQELDMDCRLRFKNQYHGICLHRCISVGSNGYVAW